MTTAFKQVMSDYRLKKHSFPTYLNISNLQFLTKVPKLGIFS